MAVDPGCKTTVEEDRAAGAGVYRGRTRRFCSETCRERFGSDPEMYPGAEKEGVGLRQVRKRARRALLG